MSERPEDMPPQAVEVLSQRPSVTDFEVDFSRHRIPIVRVLESLSRFKDLPPLRGQDLDIGTRKEAVIISFRGGELVIFEKGTLASRFQDFGLDSVRELVSGALTMVADISGWRLSEEPLVVETELVYDVPTSEDAIGYLMSGVDLARLESMGIHFGKDLHGVGLRFFLSAYDDRLRDMRLQVEPLVTEPASKFFVRAYYRQKDAKVDMLTSHLAELTGRVEHLLAALPVSP